MITDFTSLLIGAIRWDAWFPYNTCRGFVDPSLYSKYNYRMPFYGWFDTCVESEEEIMHKQIEFAAEANLDFWSFVWYPEDSEAEEARKLSYALRNYMKASNHYKLKFALILQTGWVAGKGTEKWRNSYVAEIVDKIKDKQYVKVEGNRPLIFWMDTSFLSDKTKGFGENWHEEMEYFKEEVCKAGFGIPFIADMRNDYDSAIKFGFDAVSDYGPASVGHVGHGSYRELVRHDWEKIKDVKGLKVVPGVSALIDPRPRELGEFCKYSDFTYGHSFEIPTAYEWIEHLKSMAFWLKENKDRTCDPGVLVIYSWNEIDEGGPGIVPTKQEGTMFLDGIKAVKTGIYPEFVINRVNNSNPSIRYTGSFEVQFPVYECYCNELSYSSTLGDYFEFDFIGSNVSFIGEKGPGCGATEVYLDGILAEKISLFEFERKFQVIFRSETLKHERHFLKVVIVEKNNIPMNGNYFALDCIIYESQIVDGSKYK